MASFTVPDRRSGSDPNEVIDPSLVKDSTAGLQRFLDSTPAGSRIVLPFDLQVNGTVYVTNGRSLQAADPVNGRKRILAPNAYPWRVTPDLRKTINGKPNAAYNPDGICSPWLYDLTHSVMNPYGKPGTGGEYGGYDGTTGASGVDYDGKHLSTRLTAPFLPKHVGDGIRVLAYGGFSQIVAAVSADGKTVTWVDKDGTALHEDSTHTCAWAINAKLGWCVTFMPNPAWAPRYVTDKNWHNYEEAIRLATTNNRGRTPIVVRDTGLVVGLEVVGANPTWGQGVLSYDQSRPAVSEFQHGIYLQDLTSVAYLCHSHHHNGDGFGGPGPVVACRSDYTGRHGMVGHYDDKLIDGCIIDLAHRASIDFESPNPTRRARVRNTAIGNHGISVSSPLIDCVFERLHSTDDDVNKAMTFEERVAARKISGLTMLMRGAAHGPSVAGASKNVSYLNLDFDVPVKNLLVCHGIDGLHVHGGKANVSEYFVKTYYKSRDACTNVDISGNDGGPKMLGQMAPVPPP